jgi:hypothetical protein
VATISKNFDGAFNLTGSSTVEVRAKSLQDDKPMDEPKTTTLYVFIVGSRPARGIPPFPQLMAHTPPGVETPETWSVAFDSAVPPLVKGDVIDLIGVAIDSKDSTRNYTWTGSEQIVGR